MVGAAVVILALAAGPLTQWMYPELTGTPAGADLAADLLRILVPTILFLSLAGAISGVLYSFERFTMPAVVSIVWNLTIIAAIALFNDSLGVDAIAWGMLIGTVLEVVMLAGAARYHGRWLWPGFGLTDPLLRRVLLLMVPITITLGVLNFNALIGTWFAQFVSDRAAAEIGYAFRLYQLPQGIFAVTIGTVLFPSLSRFAAQKDEARFRDTVSLGVRQMIFVSLPFVAWFLVMPAAFVQLVYERGQFGADATVEVAGALAFFSVGLVFANSNIMLNRAFQSMQKPWLPMYVSFGNLAVNVLLCWLLYKPLGVPGITLSMATVSAVNFFALFFLLRRDVGRIDGRRMAEAAGGALLCAAALAAVSYGVWRALRGLRRRRLPAARRCRGRRRRGRRRRLPGARQAAQARGAQRGAPGAAGRRRQRPPSGLRPSPGRPGLSRPRRTAAALAQVRPLQRGEAPLVHAGERCRARDARASAGQEQRCARRRHDRRSVQRRAHAARRPSHAGASASCPARNRPPTAEVAVGGRLERAPDADAAAMSHSGARRDGERASATDEAKTIVTVIRPAAAARN